MMVFVLLIMCENRPGNYNRIQFDVNLTLIHISRLICAVHEQIARRILLECAFRCLVCVSYSPSFVIINSIMRQCASMYKCAGIRQFAGMHHMLACVICWHASYAAMRHMLPCASYRGQWSEEMKCSLRNVKTVEYLIAFMVILAALIK